MRLTLLGVGAMHSPRYRPAGLLLAWRGHRVMFDGGSGAAPPGRVDAWLVTDAQAELIREIRHLARGYGSAPSVTSFTATRHEQMLRITPHEVTHTSHPTYGYLVEVGDRRVVWAPEFWEFPVWAAGADLMFADAAGWRRPIHFANRVGGHASVLDTARAACEHGVRRLVFAHLGRPSIRAIDDGLTPPFGEWASEGRVFQVSAPRRRCC